MKVPTRVCENHCYCSTPVYWMNDLRISSHLSPAVEHSAVLYLLEAHVADGTGGSFQEGG